MVPITGPSLVMSDQIPAGCASLMPARTIARVVAGIYVSVYFAPYCGGWGVCEQQSREVKISIQESRGRKDQS